MSLPDLHPHSWDYRLQPSETDNTSGGACLVFKYSAASIFFCTGQGYFFKILSMVKTEKLFHKKVCRGSKDLGGNFLVLGQGKLRILLHLDSPLYERTIVSLLLLLSLLLYLS